jgi:hypothetical protein
LRNPGGGLLVLDTISRLQKNTRRNATGNTYSTAPLSFNPMSHVGTNALQSSQYGRILVREDSRVKKTAK